MSEFRHPHIDMEFSSEGELPGEDDLHKSAALKEFFFQHFYAVAMAENIGQKSLFLFDPDITAVFWQKAGASVLTKIQHQQNGSHETQWRSEPFEVRNVSLAITVVGEGEIEARVSGSADRRDDLEIEFSYPLDGSIDFMVTDKKRRALTKSLSNYDGVPTYHIY